MVSLPQIPDLDSLCKSLNSFSGRDKALRTFYFLLQLHANRSSKKTEWMSIAKQMSTARLVLRQFNSPSQLKACQQLVPLSKTTDKFDFTCISAITGIYSVYSVIELLAWMSDAKVLTLDAGRLFRWCLYCWVGALVFGLAKQIRTIYRKGLDKANDDLITLLSLTCDFMSAINALPYKILWAGKLTPSQSSTFSLIASFIGWSRTF